MARCLELGERQWVVDSWWGRGDGMTEAEWLTSTDPTTMMNYLRERASNRKKRLFAVACCRRLSHLVVETGWHNVLEITEQYADGSVPSGILDSALQQIASIATALYDQTGDPQERYTPNLILNGAYGAIYEAALRNPLTETPVTEEASFMATEGGFAGGTARQAAGTVQTAAGVAAQDGNDAAPAIAAIAVRRTEECFQCQLVRDIFGNPFRRIALDPAWLTPKVKTLAQAIYDDRSFERMPELADTLAEAGCSNPDILSHCRGPEPHVRGCWVVDLVLGKE